MAYHLTFTELDLESCDNVLATDTVSKERWMLNCAHYVCEPGQLSPDRLTSIPTQCSRCRCRSTANGKSGKLELATDSLYFRFLESLNKSIRKIEKKSTRSRQTIHTRADRKSRIFAGRGKNKREYFTISLFACSLLSPTLEWPHSIWSKVNRPK